MGLFWNNKKIGGKFNVNSKTKQLSFTINKKSAPKGFFKRLPKEVALKLKK